MGNHHNRRRAKRIQEAAEALARGERPGADDICAVCGRRLYGELAMSRGLGWQCWGHVQRELAEVGRVGLPASAMASLQGELQL